MMGIRYGMDHKNRLMAVTKMIMMTCLIPTMQKWKTSSSSRRTDTSSDELAASLDNDADDFVKMDARLQMKVLCCRSPDEKVRVYKEYVCELLHELVMTETHSEELEYELGLKSETIEQLQHKIESLMAPEAFQTLREFEDSAEFDKPYDSQGELRALCRKQEAEVHILLERVNAAEEREAALRHQVAAKDDELAQLSVAHRQLQTDLRNENKRREESDKKTSVLREKLDALRRSSQHPSIQASLDEALSKAAHFREVAEARQREIEEYAAKINELNRQVVSHADALQTSESLYQAALQRHEVDVQRVHASYRDELDVLSSKFKQCDLVRRKLHNQVMELKGNIRVFCRIRPHLVSERSSGRPLSEVGLNVYMFPDYDKDKRRVVLVGDAKAHTSYAQQLNSSSHNDTKKWSFEFDQVFNWHATQHEMFEEVAALIQSAVDGYNVSIFAYGQTGYEKRK
ncbi:hypothetical protein DYB32_002316 [Aphanomyces invadans]|uniref:Kinesin motor domain-containing protein n=1 Tax=Aphanomyces invadans TaxID=157072 RepID=A0A3R6VET6_9STRA|nr:hypothetical protein DYB32_002316 [Aphanomyces invadans]